jgi:lipopolysaccharide transport system ATP-binding protein
MRYLHEFRRRGTLLFVSHDTGAVVNLCDRAVWLERGVARGAGPAKEVCRQYLAALVEESGEEGEGFRIGGRAVERGEVPDLVRDPRWQGMSAVEVFDFDPEAPWFGHGGAVIESAGFYEPGGGRLSVASGGDEIELRISCRAERLLAQPIVGFMVRDRLGQILFGDNTYLTYRSAPRQIQPGHAFTATFRFHLPYLALGEYTVTPSIIEGTQADHVVMQWMEGAIRMHAVASPIRRGLVGLPMEEVLVESR